MAINHVKTSTEADDPDAALVRPSDWNSAHAYTLQDAVSLSGNTSGVLANISSGTLYLAGGNNVTLSQNGNSVTISGPHTSQFLTTAMASNRGSDFVAATAAFAGTSASGTIASNGISVSIGPYITTAMASNRGSDFVAATAAFAGTNASGTIASNGISVSVNATVAQTNQTIGLYASSNTYLTSSGTVDARSMTFRGDKSITVGVSGSEVMFSVGAYLTTAMASNRGTDFVQANAAFAGTNASGTIASNGISVSVATPIPIGTAVKDVASAGSTGTITRYAPEDHAHAGVFSAGVSNIGNTAGDTAVRPGRIVFAGGNNITLSMGTAAGSLQTVTISAFNQTAPVVSNAIQQVSSATGSGTNTSRFAADDHVHLGVYSVGVSTGGNTSGDTGLLAGRMVLAGGNNITLSVGTAAGQLQTITISAPNLGAGAMSAGVSNLGNTAGSTGVTGTRLVLVGSDNMTLSQSTDANGGTVSFLAGGGAQSNQTIGIYASSNTTMTSSGTLDARSMSIRGLGNVSIGYSANEVLISGLPAATLSFYANVDIFNSTNSSTISVSRLAVVPFVVPYYLSGTVLRTPANVAMTSTSWATSAATMTGGWSRIETHQAVLYSRNTGANSMTIQYYSSTSGGWTWGVSYSVAVNGTQASSTYGISYVDSRGSNTNTTFGVSESTNTYRQYTSVFSNFSTMRWHHVPFAMSLTPGQYWLASGSSTSSTSSGATTNNLTNLSFLRSYHWMVNQNQAIEQMNAATNSSNGVFPGLGSWSTNSQGATTSSIPLSQISTNASQVHPFFQIMMI